ncbi:2-oxo-tetronate isomerase [Phyllobacterium myrsinacearum]|nr:2-oxo-tetronate isomerase [Phyllobacterium myrsinacearum]
MPRFAANLTMMFNEVDFIDRFAAASAAGFDAVEYLFPYDYDPEIIGNKLKSFGLEQALFNLPPGNWSAGERGIAALVGREEEFRTSVETALEYVRSTDVGRVHVMSGLAERSDASALKTFRNSLAFLCERAGEAGIDVLIEPINPRDMPGYFLNNFDFAADVIDGLKMPNLKLQFDIYHRQIIHGDVLHGLRELMPIIGHVQIASVPLRNEPGTGELDDFRIVRALGALGYTGFIGCEYRPANDTVAGLHWLSDFEGKQ